MPLKNLIIIVFSAVISLACYAKVQRNHYADTFSDAMNIIDKNALDVADPRALFDGAMRGMISELDEHSEYIAPEKHEGFNEQLQQRFGGVGISVEKNAETQRLTVVVPLPGQPAFKAGMRAGDEILSIDGTSTDGMDLSEAVRLMRGEEGESVTLTVGRKDVDEPIKFVLQRAIIPLEYVKGDVWQEDGSWDFFLEDHPNIGYIRLTGFGEHTAEELRRALDYGDHKIDSLILDLRDNPGGLLDSAIEICDMFIDKTAFEGRIVYTAGRNKEKEEERFANDEVAIPKDVRIAVLINGGSASASEIVSACLKDHGRAIVVGERSFGKGTVQKIIPLEGGKSAIKLTTATYWRPSERNIHRKKDATDEDEWGVKPTENYEVPLTDEEKLKVYEQRRARDIKNFVLPDSNSTGTDNGDDKPNARDPQLEKAIEYLTQQERTASLHSTPQLPCNKSKNPGKNSLVATL